MTVKQTTTLNTLHTGLSIIIPAYNAEKWITPTVEKIISALKYAKIVKAEIIIIDDGSTDGTLSTAKKIKYNIPVLVHHQSNSGRFLARKKGIEIAKYPTIFFVDTRVWIDEKGLKYVSSQQTKFPERIVWNGDVEVHKKGNIIARFGDSITQIGWRRYHGNPRLLSYGIDDFDHYPKGTGIFIVPKKLLEDAIRWFESQTKDIKNSSDDTLLIRYIARKERIWISPGFTSTYFARNTFKAFIAHTYNRGKFFVDGFLRKGTRFFYPLIAFLVATALLPVLLFLAPKEILLLAGIVWVSELIVALLLKLAPKDALSLFALTPVFTVVYGAGIWSAVIKRLTTKLR